MNLASCTAENNIMGIIAHAENINLNKFKKMTRKERLQKELDELIQKRNKFVREGKLVQSLRMKESIENKEAEIKNCEYYEFKPLAELIDRDTLTKHKVYSKLLEVSLAADYLADCAVDCMQVLNNLGIERVKICEDVERIRKIANSLSALPCREEYAQLYDLMMDNDKLVSDIHTLTRLYMSQKLKGEEYQV